MPGPGGRVRGTPRREAYGVPRPRAQQCSCTSPSQRGPAGRRSMRPPTTVIERPADPHDVHGPPPPASRVRQVGYAAPGLLLGTRRSPRSPGLRARRGSADRCFQDGESGCVRTGPRAGSDDARCPARPLASSPAPPPSKACRSPPSGVVRRREQRPAAGVREVGVPARVRGRSGRGRARRCGGEAADRAQPRLAGLRQGPRQVVRPARGGRAVPAVDTGPAPARRRDGGGVEHRMELLLTARRRLHRRRVRAHRPRCGGPPDPAPQRRDPARGRHLGGADGARQTGPARR